MAKINPSFLNQMIAEAAYYRSEQRNFAPGYEVQDWLEAEQAVTAILKSAKRSIADPLPIEASTATPQRKKTVIKVRKVKATAQRAAAATAQSIHLQND